MPDVGILNLQIHDDSAKAAEGLSKLVAKLGEMKNAVSGIRLNSVATGIGKLAKAVNDEISGSTIAKLNELANALERISGASGNVGGIRISFGGRGQSAEDMATQMQAARDAVANTTNGLEQVGQSIQEDTQGAEGFAGAIGKVNEIVQQTGWTAQATAEQFAQMFQAMNSMRMSSSLGEGANPFALGDGTGGSGADWTYWKDGAIEVEGAVTDAMEAIGVGAGDAVLKLTGVVEATSEIASSVQEMADSSEGFENTASEFDSVTQSVQQTADALRDYDDAIEFARKWNASGVNASGYKGQESADIEYVNSLIESASQADLLTMRIDALRDKLYQMAGSGKATGDQIARMVSQIQNLQAKLDGLGYTADDVKKSFSEIMVGANGLDGAFKRMFPTISGLLSRFKQLVKYRMLRAVIKQIADGFKEGTENYYWYSKAIGGEFATKMDNAASALLQMKNSIGAAAAPLINSLIPYLQIAVNWFVDLINYANQFIALLRGQSTWSRVTESSADAFKKTGKAAKGASESIKDLLANWDELNIIQSQNSGSGGSAGTGDYTENYSSMFEEVDEFNEDIQNAVKFIKEHFDDILDIAKGIGVAIAGWKISNAFGGVIGTLGKIIALGGMVAVTIKLTDLFAGEYAKSGEPGWLIADALTGAIGGALAWRAAKSIAGTGFANIVTGLTLIIAGGVNMDYARSASAQGKDAQSIMLRLLGSVEKGIGAALIAAGFTASVPLAVGVGATVALYEYAVNAFASVNITGIKWGTKDLSHEQVRDFVRSELLAVDVEAQVTLINAKLEVASSAEAALRTQAASLIGPINSLRLGVDVEGSLQRIYDGIVGDGGLLQKFRESANANKELVQTGEALAPTFNAAGENISEETLNLGTESWNELTNLMDTLGADLSRHFARSMDETLSDELRAFERKAVDEIADVMIRVASAGSAASTKSEAVSNLAFNLEDATKGTFQDVLDTYDTYIDELIQSTKELKRAEAGTFASAAAKYEVFAEEALKKAGGNEDDEMYQYYLKKAQENRDKYQEIIDGLDQTIKELKDKASEPAKALYQKTVKTMFSEMKEVAGSFSGGEIIGVNRGAAGALRDAEQEALQNILWGGETDENLRNEVESFMLATIKDMMPDDYEAITQLIKDGLIDYSDIFSTDYIASVANLLRNNMGELTPLGQEVQNILEEILTPSEEESFDAPSYDFEVDDSGVSEPIPVPRPDLTEFTSGLDAMKDETKAAVDYALSELDRLNGTQITVSTVTQFGGAGGSAVALTQRAEGGFVRSGDLVVANENGQFEMMGKFGRQPAVANNEQIVTGISNGVAQANGGIEDRLTAIENRLIAMLNKEWVAKAEPDSGWGRHAQQSADAYSRVTG